MKILHILTSNRLSGAENMVADICMMFKGIYKMAYCSPDGPIREALRDRAVDFIPLKKINISQVRKVIREYNPDVIHAHDVKATFIATIASGKIPVISHLHGNPDEMSRITLKSILYLFSTIRVENIIAVSESCINEYVFKNIIENKAIILKNVIYLNRLINLIDKDKNDYAFDFVFIGRLSYPKNPQRVAKVASIVLKKCPNVKFGVIGDGELRKDIEDIFINEGVLDRVIFTGYLPYPYKALKKAKCMLMCSRYEGLPIAALEAMALGVPIVSTPVDGMRDVVIHNETGFLSSNDDELANAIISILSDEVLYRNMSLSSKRRFQKLNDEKNYMNMLQDVYKKLETKI